MLLPLERRPRFGLRQLSARVELFKLGFKVFAVGYGQSITTSEAVNADRTAAGSRTPTFVEFDGNCGDGRAGAARPQRRNGLAARPLGPACIGHRHPCLGFSRGGQRWKRSKGASSMDAIRLT